MDEKSPAVDVFKSNLQKNWLNLQGMHDTLRSGQADADLCSGSSCVTCVNVCAFVALFACKFEHTILQNKTFEEGSRL